MDWLFRRRRSVPATTVAERTAGDGRVQNTSGYAPYAPDGGRGDATGYIFGESDAEISRLNFQHFMFRYAFGADYSAPVAAPRSILDVACGTGRWAREIARRFPDANVMGFDINRDQLDASLAEGERLGNDYLPANCTYLQGNALERFGFHDTSFDYVMARACSAFIPAAQWPLVVAEMVRVTQPGGWVELRDFGLVYSPNTALNELTVKFANLAQKRGIHPGAGPFLGQYLQSAGLYNVQVQQMRVRSGYGSGTRAGQLMLADYLALLDRVTAGIEAAGVDSAAHWRTLLAQARDETRQSPDQQYAEVELTAAFAQRG